MPAVQQASYGLQVSIRRHRRHHRQAPHPHNSSSLNDPLVSTPGEELVRVATWLPSYRPLVGTRAPPAVVQFRRDRPGIGVSSDCMADSEGRLQGG